MDNTGTNVQETEGTGDKRERERQGALSVFYPCYRNQ